MYFAPSLKKRGKGNSASPSGRGAPIACVAWTKHLWARLRRMASQALPGGSLPSEGRLKTTPPRRVIDGLGGCRMPTADGDGACAAAKEGGGSSHDKDLKTRVPLSRKR